MADQISPLPEKNAMPAPAPMRNLEATQPDNGRDNSGALFSCLDKFPTQGWTSKPLRIINMAPQSKMPPSASLTAATNSAISNSHPANLDLMLEFGLTAWGEKVYGRGQRQIVVSLYKFSSNEGAYGAYLCSHQGASNLVARGDASSEADTSISFSKAQFFVNIIGSPEGDDECKELITKLADLLSSTISGSSFKPAVILRLPVFDRVRGSEKLIVGPLTLKRFFPAPYIGTLLPPPGSSWRAAVADYQIQEPYRERLKLLVVIFPDAIQASQAYTQYVAQLQEQHDQVDLKGEQYLTSVFKIGTSFMLCQVRNCELSIVTGAHKKLSLASLVKEFYSIY